MMYRGGIVAVIVTALALAMAPSALADADRSKFAVVLPSESQKLTGKTYEQWSAVWWQTMLPIPTAKNPTNDLTGRNCGRGETAEVFFLAGYFNTNPNPGTTRICTVPATKPLFFPIINVDCSNLEDPPFFGEDRKARAQCARLIADGIGVRTLNVTLDGESVRNLRSFRAASEDFRFHVPRDNVLSVPGPASGKAASDGYWMLLQPPSSGKHVIHFEGQFTRGPAAGFAQNVTYDLTVGCSDKSRCSNTD
jgi:hypothetical protein